MSASRRKRTTAATAAASDKFSIPREKLITFLFKLGWLIFSSLDEAKKNATTQQLEAAVMAYQAFHGLDVDGWAGPQTERSIDEPRFCGHPDRMEIGEGLGKWPDANIRWWIDPATISGLPISGGIIEEAFTWAFAQWAAVCGIKPTRTSQQQQSHVRIRFAPIDGPSKTLAWSELANNNNTAKQQQYDSAETWVNSPTPQRFQIDLGRVACHEIGHVLGIPHIANGNLLQPLYDVNIRTPQRGDISEAQARYGPPKDTLPPPPPTGDKFVITVEGTGKVSGLAATGFKVERLS